MPADALVAHCGYAAVLCGVAVESAGQTNPRVRSDLCRRCQAGGSGGLSILWIIPAATAEAIVGIDIGYLAGARLAGAPSSGTEN